MSAVGHRASLVRYVPAKLHTAVSLPWETTLASVLRVHRSRLLVVGLGAALLVPLSIAPAGAEAPAAGVAVVGTVVQAYADPHTALGRRHGTAGPLTWIEPASGPAVRVAADPARPLPRGATVKARIGAATPDGAGETGLQPARRVLAADVVAPAPKTAAASPMTTSPTNEVTVVVVHPAGGTTADTTSASDVVDAVNGPVTAYWQHESRGQIVLHAGLSSLGLTPYVSTADCSDPVALWREVEAAPSVGFHPGSYKHLLIYIPKAPDAPATDPLAACQYGIGEQSGGWGNGGSSWVRDSTTSLLAHELGHNFGLRHSDEVVCDGTILSGNNCYQYSQGDNYDVMGSSWDQLGSLSAPQAFSLGVLPYDEIASAGFTDHATKDFTLTAIALQTGTQTIRLSNHAGDQFWLEYRGAVGQDAWLADPARNFAGLDQGVILHVSAPPGGDDTDALLDATPSPQSGWDADYQTAITPGHSVWLSGLNYYITVKAASPTQASIRIQAGNAAPQRDLDRNGFPDLLAVDPGGVLYRYDGTGDGGFAGRVIMGRGWQARDLITQAGDWDGSGNAQDVVARDGSGNLWLYTGAGRSAGFTSWRIIGRGWQGMSALFSPGDFNGDGTSDLLARRRSDGALLLYPGNGTGGFLPATRIGNGWQVMTAFAPTGDFDMNGTIDFAARRSDGTLLLYLGNGHGGFAGTKVIGRGWQIFSAITGVGDWDGNGAPDLLARRTDGTLWDYPGNGASGFYPSFRIGTGWGPFRMAA